MRNRPVEQLESRTLLSTAAPPFGEITWNGVRQQTVLGEFTVLLERGTSLADHLDLPGTAQAFINSLDPRLKFKTFLGTSDVFTVSIDSSVSETQIRQIGRTIPGAIDIHPSGVLQTAAQPNDAQFTGQWALDEPAGGNNADIDAEAAWNVNRGWNGFDNAQEPGVFVAVIDSGVDIPLGKIISGSTDSGHRDINGNVWSNPGEVVLNGLDEDGNGFLNDIHGWDFFGDGGANPSDNNPDDTGGHGTAVSSTFGAETNNSFDIAGSAWNVGTIPVRAGLDVNLSIPSIVQGIYYVIDLKTRRGINVPVINISAGGFQNAPELQQAIKDAGTSGIMVVVSAGNGAFDPMDQRDEGFNIDTATIGGNNLIPAFYNESNMLTVAALSNPVAPGGATNRLAVFSNYGTRVHIAAPGEGIRMLQRTEEQVGGVQWFDGDGTSFSAPMIAGTAAMLWSIRPNATVAEVRSWILAGATSLVTAHPDIGGNINNSERLELDGALVAAGFSSGPTRNPQVTGTSGSDTIVVEPNGSNIRVRVGATTVFDRPATEVQAISVHGLQGADTITVNSTVAKPVIINGGAGNDSITASSGHDTLAGGRDSDTVTGGLGNDLLLGMGQADSLFGSGGNDLLAGDGTGASAGDLIQGDNGIDTVDYSGYTVAVVVSNDDVANDGTVGVEADNVGFTTENIAGGGGNDSLTGSNADNFINGNGGNDTITGNGGKDNMLGGNGSDRFRAEDGLVDTINGGIGGTDLFILISGTDYNVDRTEEGDLVDDAESNMEN